MMKLILSRHGETLENQQHILQGQLPGTLSPLGIAQAERLAEMLQEETIDNIVSSDLPEVITRQLLSPGNMD